MPRHLPTRTPSTSFRREGARTRRCRARWEAGLPRLLTTSDHFGRSSGPRRTLRSSAQLLGERASDAVARSALQLHGSWESAPSATGE